MNADYVDGTQMNADNIVINKKSAFLCVFCVICVP